MLTMPAPCGRDKQEEEALRRFAPLIERRLAPYRNNKSLDLEVLRTYGKLGVVEAVRSYNPTREGGASFLTHVFNRVHFWVRHGVRDGDPGLIRVPRTVTEGVRKGYLPQFLSLAEGNDVHTAVDGEEIYRERAMLLTRALSEALTNEREYIAIQMRYLEGRELKEVEEYLGLSRSQAQKLIARSLKRLREHCLAQGLSPELLSQAVLPRASAAATEDWED